METQQTMDAFRKVRRKKCNEEEGGEEETETETNQRGQSSSSLLVEEKQVWPLFFPGGVMPSFPTKKAHQRIDASCSSASSYSSSSSCSSPLSSSSLSSSSSSCESGLDDLEQTYLRATRQSNLYNHNNNASLTLSMAYQRIGHNPQFMNLKSDNPPQQSTSMMHGKSPLFALGSDIMAQVMAFLEPPQVLGVLTMPLSKEWRQTFSANQDLWKVLCLLEPFKANVGDSGDDGDDDDDDSFCDLNDEVADGDGANGLFGKYRLMFTSFVRCIRYLSRIKEDTLNGRPPSVVDYGGAGFPHFGASKSLGKFLSRTRAVAVVGNAHIETDEDDISAAPIGVADNSTLTGDSSSSSGRKVRFFRFEEKRVMVSHLFQVSFAFFLPPCSIRTASCFIGRETASKKAQICGLCHHIKAPRPFSNRSGW
jgi:hypothetical protein